MTLLSPIPPTPLVGDFTIYRLALDDPLQWWEQIGDPVTNQGGAPVPAIRSAIRHAVSLATFVPEDSGALAARLTLRRQLRSLLNNTPLKLSGLYLQWSTDPEQNGWYIPDQGQLADGDGASGLATGYWKIENFNWFVVGHPSTHRRALVVVQKDLRTGLYARDIRRVIFSTDFSGLDTFPIVYLPPGADDGVNTVSGLATGGLPLPAGEDGGQCSFLSQGNIDGARISFEQADVSVNLGQVVAYDRRGNITAPASGPDPAWEEAYGPDDRWNWATASQPADCPVLDNGRCRVRYDASVGAPGFRIDVWTGTAWAEQGKVTIQRSAAAGTRTDDTWSSASLTQYGPTRAVMLVVMRATGDGTSREEIYVTLGRGWSGPRFEVYPAPNPDGSQAGAWITWYDVDGSETNASAVKIDAGGGGIVSTVNSGSFGAGAFIGASTFTGENHWTYLGQGRAYACVGAVLQANIGAYAFTDAGAYASLREAVSTQAEATGYVGVQLAFYAQVADQRIEAEAIRNTTSGTTSVITVTGASGGQAVMDTQTAETNSTIVKATDLLVGAKYRVLARVYATAGATAQFTAVSGSAGSTLAPTTTSATLTWVDCGDLVIAAGGGVAVAGWRSAGSAGNAVIDLVEFYKMEDRGTVGPQYDGARDLGEIVLTDSRTIETIVTRST